MLLKPTIEKELTEPQFSCLVNGDNNSRPAEAANEIMLQVHCLVVCGVPIFTTEHFSPPKVDNAGENPDVHLVHVEGL